MELQYKNAVVTGAGRGMGRSIALDLAEAGANVAVADIDRETVEETSEEIKGLGRESVAIHADMGSVADIDRMIAEAKDAFGRVDIIVNNAGVTPLPLRNGCRGGGLGPHPPGQRQGCVLLYAARRPRNESPKATAVGSSTSHRSPARATPAPPTRPMPLARAR